MHEVFSTSILTPACAASIRPLGFRTEWRTTSRYRPAYPDALLTALRREIGLSQRVHHRGHRIRAPASRPQLLLRIGCTVFAVEPNAEMRRAADGAPRKRAAIPQRRGPGRGDDARRPQRRRGDRRAGVSLVCDTRGQNGVHPHTAARRSRSCSSGTRDGPGARPFLSVYERCFGRSAPTTSRSITATWTRRRLRAFFGGPYRPASSSNVQIFDFDGLRGRSALLVVRARTAAPGSRADDRGAAASCSTRITRAVACGWSTTRNSSSDRSCDHTWAITVVPAPIV